MSEFDAVDVPTVDVVNELFAVKIRRKSADEVLVRQNAKVVFTNWLRLKRKELPFDDLNNLQIDSSFTVTTMLHAKASTSFRQVFASLLIANKQSDTI